jgi:hypothetical protein
VMVAKGDAVWWEADLVLKGIFSSLKYSIYSERLRRVSVP